MEAVVLLGLVGAGYLFNKGNENNNPINNAVNKEISDPSGDNLYNSDFYNETDNMIRNLASKNFESSQTNGSMIINNQKLNRIGSELNKPLNQQVEEASFNEIKEGFDNFTYSNATGGYIPRNDFLSNDQGIKVQPYFSRAPTSVNYDDPRRLNALQGGNEFYQEKRETTPFFEQQKDLTNVFGNTFGVGIGDKKRYDSGLLKTNELPFTQERVAHIDQKSDFNREINQMIAEKTNVDLLRSQTNPKLTFKAKVLSGKNMTESRGKEGLVFQHNPDKFYQNDPDKWFVTNGAFLEKSLRPEQILPDTNRRCLNTQPIGAAAPAVYEGHEKRQAVRKPMKYQLGTDTIRNTGVETGMVGTDLQVKGYRALPNERDVTTLRNYTSNVATDEKAPTMELQDDVRKTKKQTTIHSKNNGNMANSTINTSVGLQDDVRITKKQTTIHSKNNGNISGGYEKPTAGVEKPETTMKDLALFKHFGIAGGPVQGDMVKDNYQNAETNPTKEIIAQGREPTLNNVKIANGRDKINIEIDKLEKDYMNHRINSIDKVYQEIPTDNNCEITTMKDRLEDTSIATRIDPSLLNPFRNNPYTQSLESFAY
tara:strand:+ start:132 stop:1919 length:1788 start_codon:yes stop_codon:yes gene_type:complete